jgi:adenylate cyclase
VPDPRLAPLLEGLDGPAREEREALLELLLEQGFRPERLLERPPEMLPFVATERVVMEGPPTLTLRDMAGRAQLTVEQLAELRHLQGLPRVDPDEVRFSEAEAERAKVAAQFAALGLTNEHMAGVLRVLGRGLAQTAQAMRATALELVLEPGATERELAERYAAAVEAVMPLISPLLDTLLRQHLRNMLDSEAVDAAERVSGRMPGARDVAIGFADLVGFTRLGEQVEPERVGDVALRLEELAGQAATPEVRMVKTIGDAAMFAAPSSPELVDVALRLVELVDAEGEGFPQVRVGIACGAALQRGGDWFGRPVNLASRITGAARAGSVLVAEDAAGDERFAWSFAGERKLRGVPGPVKLFRARRPAPATEGSLKGPRP